MNLEGLLSVVDPVHILDIHRNFQAWISAVTLYRERLSKIEEQNRQD